MSLTLAYDATLSRVRISATALGITAVTAVFERSTNQTTWTTVRGGAAAAVVAGSASVDDYEFAADVPNYYRVSAYNSTGRQIGPALNANPTFEVDASNWAGVNGATIARSTAQFHDGVASGLVTPNGTTAIPQVQSEEVTVTPLAQYSVYGWLRSTSAATRTLNLFWFNAAHTFISTSPISKALAAGVWTQYGPTAFTAPAGAAFARVVTNDPATPAAANTWHLDSAQMVRLDGGPMFTASITPALGEQVWLKSIARPFLNRQVTVRDVSDVARPTRSGTFDVVGRSYPIAVTDLRASRRWTLDLSTYSPEEASDLDLMLASGDILYLHVPTTDRISATPAGYVAVGDVAVQMPPTADLAMRIFSLPCTEVAAPGPDVVGATLNWQTVLNAYPTWSAVLAAQASWNSMLELVGSPTDVVVP